MYGLAAVRLAQLPRSPSECLFPKAILSFLSEAEKFFFDLNATMYWDEEEIKAIKERYEKDKFKRDHGTDAPVEFSTYQELLRQARENADAGLFDDGADE